MTYVIGVDVGGTCTDCVVVDERGKMTVAKAFSTPADFSKGIVDSLEVAVSALGLDVSSLLENTRLFLHSTTVAENAIVNGELCKAGLLVTRGFEHTLYMTRGGYGRWSGLNEEDKKNVVAADKPPPLIPFSMIKAIRERTDRKGQALAVPEEAEIERSLRDLVGNGAEAVGVCFLWSFRNPENEKAVQQIVKRLYPKLFFTMSSDLAPIEGEYERTSTVALNVRLGPIISGYLSGLRQRLEQKGFRGVTLVMQAHGGLLRVEDAPARAVGMIESGPVGGLVGSRAIGELLSFPNILATDMGGTTFKAGVVRAGRIEYEREPMVVRYHYVLDKMEVVSIGLAGGSVISVNPRTKLPNVGPRSAGAYPGPVCYGFGGQEPTISDVDLLLGFLDPRFFLGGKASLDKELAHRAFKSHVADPLNMDVTEAAGATYRLANSMMYDLLHKQTVEKGLDPREYVLFAYGGTAGMHMAAVGQALGVSRIVVPHSASVHGAFGLVSADVVYSDVATRNLPSTAAPDQVNEIFATVANRVTERLTLAGFRREDILIQRSINMRYRRQIHVINTPVDGEEILTEPEMERICGRFEALYAERYGKDAGYRAAGMEMVSFLVRGIALLRKPELRSQQLGPSDPDGAYIETRRAYFSGLGQMCDARCYDFERLFPGNIVNGPAIVWTPITTVVVQPGQQARCDGYRNLVITW